MFIATKEEPDAQLTILYNNRLKRTVIKFSQNRHLVDL